MLGHACMLHTLDLHPDPKSFYGLCIKNQKIAGDPRIFTCCDASGLVHSSEESSIRVCGMQNRLAKTSKLLAQYVSLGGDETLSLEEIILSSCLRKELDHAKSTRRSMAFLPHLRQDKSHSLHEKDFWALAFTASWRYGLDVFVVSFTKTEFNDSVMKRFLESKKFPAIVILLNVGNLHQAEPHSLLDLWVNFVYQSESKLWVHLSPLSENKNISNYSSHLSYDFNSSMKDKLQKIKLNQKNENPFNYAGSAVQSRLEDMKVSV